MCNVLYIISSISYVTYYISPEDLGCDREWTKTRRKDDVLHMKRSGQTKQINYEQLETIITYINKNKHEALGAESRDPIPPSSHN